MNIIELTPYEITRLMELLSDADLHERRVRVAIDGGFKIKVGEGMWSAPMGWADFTRLSRP